MDIISAIEIYVGRKVDFNNEVILQDDGFGSYIKAWNIYDKKKPSNYELQKAYYDGIDKYNIEKNAQQQENKQQQIAVQSATYLFDMIKETVAKADILESKIKNGFDNAIIDTLQDDSNIDWSNSSNVVLDPNKGIIQIVNISSTGIIQTKPFNITSKKIQVAGQGMYPEYNWDAKIEVSNDNGITFYQVVFSSSETLSDIYSFISSGTNQVVLKITFVPKQQITGKAYISLFALLF